MADKFQLKALITGVDKLSPTLAGVRKNISTFRKNLESTGLGKIGWSDIITGGAMAAPFIAGARAAIDFESQMADVRKVVNFDTPDQFKKMGDDIGRMSERLPMAATDIAKIVAAGGQSGIARDELLGFAEAAVKMGIAFDQTADESGDMMTTWRTAFRMNQAEVVSLADRINYLGNTGPANTKKISAIVTEVGALGEVAGMSSAQVAAIGATMAGVGVKQDVAATGIKNFMLAMTKGTAATKAQADAYKALRLDAKTVAENMQKDAQGTTLDLLKRISLIDAAKRPAILSELFGTESITAITPLLTNLELLRSNLDKVNDAKKFAGSMEQEYASRAATTRNNMTLLRGSIDRVAVAIGNALLPGINAVLEQLRPWISHMAQMISDNPQLVRGIVIAGAAFTALRAAVFAATVATRVLGVAFAATPIGLIAAGIAAAAGLIVANWEKVGPFFSALWELIKAYTTPFMEFIKSVFGWAPLALIIKNWEPIVGWFKGLWDRVSPYLEPLLKLFGGGDGESLTVRVQRLADEQKARNSVAGGSGALVQANAVQVAQGVQAAREQAFGVSPEALLRAATPLPAPGGLLRASGQLPEPGALLRQSAQVGGKQQLEGEVRVAFDNSPPGLRVESVKTSQPGVTITPNVGRRTMGGTYE
ncbi:MULTISPECIES: phage tail tape measure protein [Pseudomonas]|uniref:Phage tail protein n=1 Tax=Pseudomonas putida (strain ATCC 47054 / DSM 6125 / CFBP 8728 / NCIMB 11950 / KT2440) TaxID=160488 RepID=Q88G60_PSEPK|nr:MULTISPECIES: phage tail tape measure protein [Pseudomonas]AAN69459.1 putative Phage tail protein [Pseudomonas putida KT2440]KMU94284.1 tail protein [Pseudomonas putida]KMY31105.1 tail protein [Pseudomonas putida]MDD2082608.1 phage tail tape measure protein [Pseudomonas putida]PXZ45897.1 phage tail tape measure protein [Pseudomonas sp. SMT-1]